MAVTRASALDLDATSYEPHWLHGPNAIWREKNCYVDVWIEALHALGLDPLPSLAFTLGMDFEDDQWTFFKPPTRELRFLYGIHVSELCIWRPLIDHVIEHVAAGKLVFTEADAFLLPDTRGTDYQRKHTKSTIAIEAIDRDARTLRYFHNTGFWELGGDDFSGLFDATPVLPLFAEYARVDRVEFAPPNVLASRSLELFHEHIRVPRDNPFTRYASRFRSDLASLWDQPLDTYHAYAFATLRQLGAGFELAGAYVGWLALATGAPELLPAAAHFSDVATTAKALILKAARAVALRKPLDDAFLDTMGAHWRAAMDACSSFARPERSGRWLVSAT